MKNIIIPSIISAVNPVESDNVSSGFPLGQKWFNEVSGEEFVHKTDGVWINSIVDVNEHLGIDSISGSTSKFLNERGEMVEVEVGSTVEIVNNLTDGGTTKALSAEQGKVLQSAKMNRLQNGNGNVDINQLQTLVGLGFDLSGARLSYANLTGANLSFANLENAYLYGASLDGAYLDGANLSYANLDGANFRGASLLYANLIGANLYSANLDGANFENANLAGANLYATGGLDSDINISFSYVNKNPFYDNAVWSLIWTNGNTYQCDPSTGLFTQQ